MFSSIADLSMYNNQSYAPGSNINVFQSEFQSYRTNSIFNQSAEQLSLLLGLMNLFSSSSIYSSSSAQNGFNNNQLNGLFDRSAGINLVKVLNENLNNLLGVNGFSETGIEISDKSEVKSTPSPINKTTVTIEKKPAKKSGIKSFIKIDKKDDDGLEKALEKMVKKEFREDSHNSSSLPSRQENLLRDLRNGKTEKVAKALAKKVYDNDDENGRHRSYALDRSLKKIGSKTGQPDKIKDAVKNMTKRVYSDDDNKYGLKSRGQRVRDLLD